MTVDTICYAAGLALHLHYAPAGVVLTPARVPQVAPQFYRSM